MRTFTHNNKSYRVGFKGFLSDPNDWDENFAEGMAPSVKIPDGLTKEHWNVIHFIRHTFEGRGQSPLVYETCRMNNLHLKDLKELFPTGYQRGACKLAGITYRDSFIWQTEPEAKVRTMPAARAEKVYRVDVRGFLVEPGDWDEQFAIFKAYETKVPQKLTDKHWDIIRFLRNRYAETKSVPTVYETCEANQIELEELERLFPDGYHRGAVKIAGLRAIRDS